MKSKKFGTIIMLLGMLLLVASLSLTIYNTWDDRRAGETAEEIIRQWDSEDDAEHADEEPDLKKDNKVPDYVLDPDMDMPTKEMDGIVCIGTIEIPALEILLPVISEWSYPKLRIAPCRFTGSAYSDDLVIAAHNYNRHFGMLKTLQPGAEVIFTDAADHVFYYTVAGIEILEPTAVEEMVYGNWDLTLFTCTIGGQTRVTVRCTRTDIK